MALGLRRLTGIVAPGFSRARDATAVIVGPPEGGPYSPS